MHRAKGKRAGRASGLEANVSIDIRLPKNTLRKMSTLKQRAYKYIRQAMSDGVLSAGDRLSPAALAKEIGISHIPVREAISQLFSEGENGAPRKLTLKR